MKLIKAYVRRTEIDAVVHSLKLVGVKSLSLIAVEGVGDLSDPHEAKLSKTYITNYSKIYKIELVCRATDADSLVKRIRRVAHTGEPGDGAIFVSPVENGVKIRTGKEGHFSLDQATTE